MQLQSRFIEQPSLAALPASNIAPTCCSLLLDLRRLQARPSDHSSRPPHFSQAMIASQVGRLARATATTHTCTAHRTTVLSRSVASATLKCSDSSQQRRLSSSKASCPPDDGPNSARPAATTSQSPQPARSPGKASSGGKQARGRKPKDAEWLQKKTKQSSEEEADYSKLPSVPSTDNIQPAGG